LVVAVVVVVNIDPLLVDWFVVMLLDDVIRNNMTVQ
jgi:hypothetical protein